MLQSWFAKWFGKAPVLHPAGTVIERQRSPFPFIRVAGRDAAKARAALQAAHPGHTAIIWGAPKQTNLLFEMHEESAAHAGSDHVAEIIKQALSGSGRERLAAHQAEAIAAVKAYYVKQGWAYPEPDDAADVSTEEETVDPALIGHDRLIGFDHHQTRQPAAEVVIGLIPTEHAWQVPAFLRFGDWNDCPPAHVHTAFAREWSETYGAELVVVTSDILEFEVARPPTDDASATALAEIFATYCSDIVDQGVGSKRALAQVLKGGHYWYFWWD